MPYFEWVVKGTRDLQRQDYARKNGRSLWNMARRKRKHPRTNRCTFACWIRAPSPTGDMSGWRSVFHWGNSNHSRHPAMWLHPSQDHMLISCGHGNAVWFRDLLKHGVKWKEWFHFAFAVQDREVQVFINGVFRWKGTLPRGPLRMSPNETINTPDPWHNFRRRNKWLIICDLAWSPHYLQQKDVQEIMGRTQKDIAMKRFKLRKGGWKLPGVAIPAADNAQWSIAFAAKADAWNKHWRSILHWGNGNYPRTPAFWFCPNDGTKGNPDRFYLHCRTGHGMGRYKNQGADVNLLAAGVRYGEMFHFVCVVNGRNVKFYVNAKRVKEVTLPKPPSLHPAHWFHVADPWHHANGEVERIQFFARPLDDRYIAAIAAPKQLPKLRFGRGHLYWLQSAAHDRVLHVHRPDRVKPEQMVNRWQSPDHQLWYVETAGWRGPYRLVYIRSHKSGAWRHRALQAKGSDVVTCPLTRRRDQQWIVEPVDYQWCVLRPLSDSGRCLDVAGGVHARDRPMTANQRWQFLEDDLTGGKPGDDIWYDSVVRIQHENTKKYLVASDHKYTTGSKQHIAGCIDDSKDEEGSNPKSYWVVLPAHDARGSKQLYGLPLRNGATLRLVNLHTRRTLHSHLGHKSPKTRQGESTTYGGRDSNDNWTLQLHEGRPVLEHGRRFVLLHRNTKWSLHSHKGHWVRDGMQEVTTYERRDSNDYWRISWVGARGGHTPGIGQGPKPKGKNLGPRLWEDRVMLMGDYLVSNHGKFVVKLQYDGNLVARDQDNKVFWQTGTARKGKPAFRFVVQGDNNVCLYDGEDTCLWTTGKTGGSRDNKTRFEMQDDRNLVVYDGQGKPLWASHTVLPGADRGGIPADDIPKEAVVGASRGHVAFRYKQRSTWSPYGGGAKLRQVAIGSDGEIWGVNQDNDIWRFEGGTKWEKRPGKLLQIAVGSHKVIWGVGTNRQPYRWTGEKWENMGGSGLAHVSCADDGETVWCTTTSHNIYRWGGTHGKWIQVPGGLSMVSVGSAKNIWGVNPSGRIYYYTGTGWTKVAGGLRWVSVNKVGHVVGVNTSGQIYVYSGVNQWRRVRGRLANIDIGVEGDDDTLRIRLAQEAAAEAEAAAVKQLDAVMFDGTTYMIKAQAGNFVCDIKGATKESTTLRSYRARFEHEGQANQLFYLEKVGDGKGGRHVVRIVSKLSGKCLNVAKAPAKQRVLVDVQPRDERSKWQQWLVEPYDARFAKLRPMADPTGLTLDLACGRGPNYWLWPVNDSPAQRFEFVAVGHRLDSEGGFAGELLWYDCAIKVRHWKTGKWLHSHGARYASGSKQQQVTGFGGEQLTNDDDKWVICPSHEERGKAKELKGRPVKEGATVRLKHYQTGQFLHSHDVASPVTQQGEVTCYGKRDENDDWVLDMKKEGMRYWKAGRRFSLIHKNTERRLHSHPVKLPGWAWRQQEVTCYGKHDDNDWWRVEWCGHVRGHTPALDSQWVEAQLAEEEEEAEAVAPLDRSKAVDDDPLAGDDAEGVVWYDGGVRLQHVASDLTLHAEKGRRSPHGSRQPLVSGYLGENAMDVFLVKPMFGDRHPKEFYGYPVMDGDIVMLEHAPSGFRLTSTTAHKSPVTSQQEVSLNDQAASALDNWRVEITHSKGRVLNQMDVVHLVHVATGARLSSSRAELPEEYGSRQKEVMAQAGDEADKNDAWRVSFAGAVAGHTARALLPDEQTGAWPSPVVATRAEGHEGNTEGVAGTGAAGSAASADWAAAFMKAAALKRSGA